MKVAINTCYGGFSLSPKAVARLAEFRGKKAYFFRSHFNKPYEPISAEEAEGTMFWKAFTTPNPPPNPSGLAKGRGKWQAGVDALEAKIEAESIDSRPDDRSDPFLIQVIAELGKEADGACARLSVIEIPDGVDYEIEEYDGLESIHERHRSWP